MKIPGELAHSKVVEYVASILREEFEGLENIQSINFKLNNFTLDKRIDLITTTYADLIQLDTIVIVADKFKMRSRTESTQLRLDRLLANFQKLDLIPAKHKILVLTHRGLYYAFRQYLKNITNDPKVVSSKIQPDFFTVSGKEIQVRLIEFPVFRNDGIIKNVENNTLTFPQMLAALQYGFLKLEQIPTRGFLVSAQEDTNELAKTANVKQIFDYLFEKSGFMNDFKGRSTRGNSGKGNSPSSRTTTAKPRVR